MKTSFISAISTPLREDDSLHIEGIEAHLEDQWRNGISGALVAGSMGRMQLLSDQTYRDLVEHSVRITAGRGEILVGVGDTSFARTTDRIRIVERFDIDGVVVLTPFFMPFTQDELVDYFRALEDISNKPLFMYDLPQLTGTKLQVETVLAVARHPNVAGIKCSDNFANTRPLFDAGVEGFRIIVAQPLLLDMLIRDGVREHLDGIYAVAPKWTVAIAEAAERGDWDEAKRRQKRLSTFLTLLRDHYPILPACSAIMNERGIPGKVYCAPRRALTDEQRDRLLAEPIVEELLEA